MSSSAYDTESNALEKSSANRTVVKRLLMLSTISLVTCGNAEDELVPELLFQLLSTRTASCLWDGPGDVNSYATVRPSLTSAG